MLFMAILVAICLGSGSDVHAMTHSEKLFEDLMSPYNNLVRPVSNHTTILTVNLTLRLTQLLDVHEKDQIMTTNMWLRQEWFDHKLRWKPSSYGGIKSLYIPSEMLWRPDIVLYNNADGKPNVTIMTKAIVRYDGQVIWEPPAIFRSLCPIDVKWFPFDAQTCSMKFGTWTHDGNQVDLVHWRNPDEVEVFQKEGNREWLVKKALDLSEYYPSVEWDIVDVPGEKHWAVYPCCDAPFIDVTVYLHLRRKPLFYSVNLVAPCIGLSLLTALAFHLPADSYEKMALCISVLVAITVFFLLLVELIPATSLAVPLIARYLLFTLILIFLSVLVTAVSVNHHFRSPTTHRMPNWMRRWILRRLPKILGMKCLLAESHEYFTADALVGMVERCLRKDSVAAKARLEVRLAHDTWDRRASVHPLILARNQSQREMLQGNHMAALRYVASSVGLIAHKIRREEQERMIEADWRYVSSVIDRLFLYIFSIVCTIGACSIILQAPMLYDYREPLLS